MVYDDSSEWTSICCGKGAWPESLDVEQASPVDVGNASYCVPIRIGRCQGCGDNAAFVHEDYAGLDFICERDTRENCLANKADDEYSDGQSSEAMG